MIRFPNLEEQTWARPSHSPLGKLCLRASKRAPLRISRIHYGATAQNEAIQFCVFVSAAGNISFFFGEFQRIFAGWAWRCSLRGVSLAFSVAMVCGVRYRGCLWCEGRTVVLGKPHDITARMHTYVYMQYVKPSQLRNSRHALENQRKLTEIGRRRSQKLDATC